VKRPMRVAAGGGTPAGPRRRGPPRPGVAPRGGGPRCARAGRWLEDAGLRGPRRWSRRSWARWADLWGRHRDGGRPSRRSSRPPRSFGDAGIKQALGLWARRCTHRGTVRHVLDGLAQRDRLLRLWELFLEERPLVVTPTSNEPAFPVDLDLVDADTTRRIMRAPDHAARGGRCWDLPAVVGADRGRGAVSRPACRSPPGRFREDLCLEAGRGHRGPAPRWRPRSIPR